MMTTFGIPYLLEDRTGDVLNTEFDELYDRMFFGVSSSSSSSSSSPTSPARTIKIFELGSRISPSSSSCLSGTLSFGRADPVIIIDVSPPSSPSALGGTVLFVRQGLSMPLATWMPLNPTRSGRGGFKFACSDGESYSWTHQASADTEWACTTASGYVVSQYKLRTPDEPKYASSSGNVFTVYESYGHIASELLASLTVVRFMQRYNISA